jgi:hypothetical protein
MATGVVVEAGAEVLIKTYLAQMLLKSAATLVLVAVV